MDEINKPTQALDSKTHDLLMKSGNYAQYVEPQGDDPMTYLMKKASGTAKKSVIPRMAFTESPQKPINILYPYLCHASRFSINLIAF